MRAVSDASSLIHAAKVPALWTALEKAFEEILVPEAVHAEILAGKEIQSPDVPVILGAISKGWIKITRGINASGLPGNLGAGEKEAICLMIQVRADWLLMDDQVASTTARLLGLPVRSLSFLIVYLVAKRLIKASEGTMLLDDLVDSGYYLGPSDYLWIKKLLKEVSRKK